MGPVTNVRSFHSSESWRENGERVKDCKCEFFGTIRNMSFVFSCISLQTGISSKHSFELINTGIC